jgi:hypothetical protein
MRYRELEASVYKNSRYLAEYWLEEKGVIHLTPYSDKPKAGGFATIGIGFKIDSNLEEILRVFGFNTGSGADEIELGYIDQIENEIGSNKLFTKSQMISLQQRLDSIMLNRFNYYKNTYEDETKRKTFAFLNSDEVRTVFQTIADRIETNILSVWLGKALLFLTAVNV